ncbi:MAG: hypothetical protein EA357_03095, partial [Micavibrio sp.]
ATSEERITGYTYHTNTTDGSGNLILGRLASITGPRTDVADVTEFFYDGNFDLEKITNALGQETLITDRDAAGRPTTIEDANGVETARDTIQLIFYGIRNRRRIGIGSAQDILNSAL